MKRIKKVFPFLMFLFVFSCVDSNNSSEFYKIGQFKSFILKNIKVFDELNRTLDINDDLQHLPVTISIDTSRNNENNVIVCDTLSFYFKKLNLYQIHLTEYSTEFRLVNEDSDKPYNIWCVFRKSAIFEKKNKTIYIEKLRKNIFIIASKW